MALGQCLRKKIIEESQIDPSIRVKDLTDEQLNKLQKAVEKYPVEGELRSQVSQNIKRLISIGAYRGIRHRRGMPVRGQRTRTNARSRKGSRRTVGISRKK